MLFLSSAIGAAFIASVFPSSAVATCCEVPNREHQNKVLDLYVDTWNGDFSLKDSTFAPSAHLYVDRLFDGYETKLYNFATSDEIIGFMQIARTGWEQYNFEVTKWAGGEGYNMALRWTLNGVIGANFTKTKTTLKPGDPVTYNGTDFLQLDECTGLIKQIDLAQDSLIEYHALGLTQIPV